MNSSTSVRTPLTPQVYHVLVALACRDMHAYALRHQAASDSGHSVVMTGATIKGVLERLVKNHWAEIIPGSNPRRYHLTTIGRSYLEGEIQRLERAILVGRIALQDGRFIVS